MKLKFITACGIWIFLFSCASKPVSSKIPTPEQKQAGEEVVAAMTPNNTVAAMKPAEEKALYENNCAKCHKLYEPAAFSQQQWAPILVRMQKKAKLDDAQMAGIADYIYLQTK